MPGACVLSIRKIFSCTEQAITHSSTITIQVSILLFPSNPFLELTSNLKTACNVGDGPENCQLNIVDLEGTLTNINIYCLSTVGTVNMISEARKSPALYSDNVNVFPDNIALFRLASGNGSAGT